MPNISLDRMCGGALAKRLNQALAEVARNIQDPNTDAEKKRKITITLTMTPDKNRGMVKTAIDTKVSTVPAEGVETTLLMGKDLKTGKVDVTEYGTASPVSAPQDHVEVNGKQVNPETGEILNQQPDQESEKVLDFRKKSAM